MNTSKINHKILYSAFYILSFTFYISLTACSDFFAADTDVILENKEYIDEENEMYAGFLGIVTKMQKIGDKAIYLTDTRAELLEPTPNAPSELFELYNWNEDLTGNSYANPAGYYDVVIACNDYLHKIKAYKDSHLSSIDMKVYNQLVSGAVRIKAWVYLTMGKIYGEAAWFDNPMTEKVDISQFPIKNLDEIVAACKDLLTNGFDGVDGKLSFLPNGVEDKSGFWVHYIEPTRNDDGGDYQFWNFMAPEYFALWGELCLWSGDYQSAVDVLLAAMNQRMSATINSSGASAITWMQNNNMASKNSDIFRKANPYRYATVSVIIYNYKYDQTNSLLRHFGVDYPNEYLLAPSDSGRIKHFEDVAFTYFPAASDGKSNNPRTTYGKDGNRYYISKYRGKGDNSIRTPNQDDVHIYIYRSVDLYFMLAEALNNLGRYAEAAALINDGFGGNPSLAWTGFNVQGWSQNGNSSSGDKGVRGLNNYGLSYVRPFKKGAVSIEDTKYNDIQILDEMILEFAVEGRTLPAMIRMARRWNDPEIIARLVCPKYGANAESIRAKIHSGGYFIKWDLK